MSKQFGAVTAADNVCVDVPAGAVYSLIGSNGAGKTTFVNMVTGYIKPDAGTIRFRTATSPGWGRCARSPGRHPSLVPDHGSAGLTMLENMLMAEAVHAEQGPSLFRPARSAQNIERAEASLVQLGIADFRHHKMSELPGGVKKLLDIAMAMAGQTDIILLDEPTSGVAADEKFPIMDRVIAALQAKGVTILFVEHDMEIVGRYASRVLAFYAGQIIANDAPDAVLANADVQRYVTGGVA
ncbi:MAG: ATP-binding cassette domain-containing protein [Burkholderiaceae bacterium]